MKFPINLSEWSGSGSGNTFRWVKNDNTVVCEYIEQEHKLEVKVICDDEEILTDTEMVHMTGKPNVFSMRITSERIVNSNNNEHNL